MYMYSFTFTHAFSVCSFSSVCWVLLSSVGLSLVFLIDLPETNSVSCTYMTMYFWRIVFAWYKNLDWLLLKHFQHVLPVFSGFCCFQREKSVICCNVSSFFFFCCFSDFIFGFLQCVYDVPRCGFLGVFSLEFIWLLGSISLLLLVIFQYFKTILNTFVQVL